MKRYGTLLVEEQMLASEYLYEHPDGGWVRWSDHDAALTEATALLDWWVREWDVHWMPQRLLDATLAWKDRAPALRATVSIPANTLVAGQTYRLATPPVVMAKVETYRHPTPHSVVTVQPAEPTTERQTAIAELYRAEGYELVEPAAPAPKPQQRHYALNPDQEDGHESPAAPEPSPYAAPETWSPAQRAKYGPAPEPSGEKCHECGSTDIDHGSEHMGAVEFPENICERCFRLRSAEAQLAAVRAEAEDWKGKAHHEAARRAAAQGRCEDLVAQLAAVRKCSDSILATGNEECLDALDMAEELGRIVKTTAPSPGARFQALVDKVGDSADDVTVFCTSEPPAPSPGAGEETER